MSFFPLCLSMCKVTPFSPKIHYKSTKKCLQGLPHAVFPCFCKLLINIYF